MTYFFDTYAIIEMLNNSSSYEFAKDETITTSVLNIAEIYNIILREKGKNAADAWYATIQYKLLEITPPIIVEAVYFRYLNRRDNISLADTVGYTLALRHKLRFLTGDSKFKNFSNVEFVK